MVITPGGRAVGDPEPQFKMDDRVRCRGRHTTYIGIVRAVSNENLIAVVEVVDPENSLYKKGDKVHVGTITLEHLK